MASFIHGYLLNELGCAIIYPNVRGSTGYGKRYCALDDVFKREDSVKCGCSFCHPFWFSINIPRFRDIGALLDHIDQNMKNELIASRVAVMGGSCPYLYHPFFRPFLFIALQMAGTWFMSDSFIIKTRDDVVDN